MLAQELARKRRSEKEWRQEAKSGKTRKRKSKRPTSRMAHAGPLRRGHPARTAGRRAADQRRTGARIGLSAAPTWRRVRWLEEQGYITGYRAEIDRRKIGLGVLAFVRVDAERNNAEATRALEDAIRAPARGGVLPLHQRRRHLRAAGGGHRPRRLFALGDGQALHLPNVKDLHTSFSLGEVKAGAALPLCARCRAWRC
jgi:Lrp/AsnC family leucine-responsive transcriptional regulator